METLDYSDFLTIRIDSILEMEGLLKIEKLTKLKKDYTELMSNNYLPTNELNKLKIQLKRIDDLLTLNK